MAKQSEHIRTLYRQDLEAAEAVVTAQYAEAERRGVVTRDSNDYDVSPEAYAKALWRNGWRRADGGKKPYLLTVLQEHTDAKARR